MRIQFVTAISLLLAVSFFSGQAHAQENTEGEVVESQENKAAPATEAQADEAPAPADEATASPKTNSPKADESADGDADEAGGGKMTAGLVAGLGSACLCAPTVLIIGSVTGPCMPILAGCAGLGFGIFPIAGIMTTDLFHKHDTTIKSLILPSAIALFSGMIFSAGGAFLYGRYNNSNNYPETLASNIAFIVAPFLAAALTGSFTYLLYDDGHSEDAESDREKSTQSTKNPRHKKHKESGKKTTKPKPKPDTQPDTTPQNVPGPDTGFYY